MIDVCVCVSFRWRVKAHHCKGNQCTGFRQSETMVKWNGIIVCLAFINIGSHNCNCTWNWVNPTDLLWIQENDLKVSKVVYLEVNKIILALIIIIVLYNWTLYDSKHIKVFFFLKECI